MIDYGIIGWIFLMKVLLNSLLLSQHVFNDLSVSLTSFLSVFSVFHSPIYILITVIIHNKDDRLSLFWS